MARLQSIQKPTTLLTLKFSKTEANAFSGAAGEIILITINGIIQGDVRISTGNPNYTMPVYPIGSLVYYAGQTPPNGYLFCNGATVSSSLYPELYSKIGTTWGGDSTNFALPNFTTDGGRFIRNLNQQGVGNSTFPDYYYTSYDDYGTYNRFTANLQLVNRTFGQFQSDAYGYHSHGKPSNSEYAGDHSHNYYGSRNATNGVQLGSDTAGVNGYRGVFGYGSAATTVSSGYHVHYGWLGYGPNQSSTLHNTVDAANSSLNNQGETRPVNHPLMFCIKY
tara:strand:+ start:96410 stop:97243 length:834 start_codon:yes stop_codon:yes gene_type:complete